MESENIMEDKNKDIKNIIINDKLKNIKSIYFIQKIYDNMNKKKTLGIVKYNKRIQNILNLNINNYKEYYENLKKIKEFREYFGFSEECYPDDKLLEVLKKHNFDFELSFSSFFE